MQLIRCIGCGGWFPDVAGPTHRYLASSPGCWAAYGEVLAREYSDPVYMDMHRLTVDAYAAQHPGQAGPQTIKSVGIHLIRLCLLLEQGLAMSQANDAMLAINHVKHQFTWLTPPPTMGAITAADALNATTVEEHKAAVRLWATEVWAAWSPHHDTIRAWAPESRRYGKRETGYAIIPTPHSFIESSTFGQVYSVSRFPSPVFFAFA